MDYRDIPILEYLSDYQKMKRKVNSHMLEMGQKDPFSDVRNENERLHFYQNMRGKVQGIPSFTQHGYSQPHSISLYSSFGFISYLRDVTWVWKKKKKKKKR